MSRPPPTLSSLASDLPDLPLGTSPQDCKVRQVERWWWELWRPGVPAEVDVKPWLANLHLTPFPLIGELTGAELHRAIKRTPKAKAPGADGWCYQDLRDWPAQLVSLLAAFYSAVEAHGKWPACFNLALVAMLHKGGTEELDDFRPIVLLSTIYRLWASQRSRLLRAWLLAIELLPAADGRGADSQAYELSMRLALARLSGVKISGLAIDWSKCYDRLPLHVLQELCEHMQIPPGLWKPMLDMYSRPRAILLQGGIGQAIVPTHGLPPGCPCAVDWLTLVMCMLTRATIGLAPLVQSRPYVDDITSDVSTMDCQDAVDAVTAMDTTARAFGGAFGLVLHPRKCKRFSTCNEVRKMLGPLPGPQVVTDFVDLGVLQSASNLRTPAESLRRAELALVKMSRISLVALPFSQRCLLVSASGVPTALFGMAAQPLSNYVVNAVRRKLFSGCSLRNGPILWRSVFLIPGGFSGAALLRVWFRRWSLTISCLVVGTPLGRWPPFADLCAGLVVPCSWALGYWIREVTPLRFGLRRSRCVPFCMKPFGCPSCRSCVNAARSSWRPLRASMWPSPSGG